MDIATRYYERTATSKEIAAEYHICHQMVPRVARKVKPFLDKKETAPAPASTDRG